MDPVEKLVQGYMRPDKNGEKGKPVRVLLGGDTFGHPVQRTLDALWLVADESIRAAQRNKENYDAAVNRIIELEKIVSDFSD